MKGKDNYGVIIHPEDFDDFLNQMTNEEAGIVCKNMIRVFQGESMNIVNERYVDVMTKKLCGRVQREREISESRSLAGSLGGKAKANGKQKDSKSVANDKQKGSSNNQIPITNTNYSPTGNKKEMCKEKYGEFENVFLTVEEFFKLKERFPDYQERIERLSAYIEQTGRKYKSHYATILSWAQKDAREKKPVKKSTDEMVYDWLNGGSNDEGRVYTDSSNAESDIYGCEVHAGREIS